MVKFSQICLFSVRNVQNSATLNFLHPGTMGYDLVLEFHPPDSGHLWAVDDGSGHGF